MKAPSFVDAKPPVSRAQAFLVSTEGKRVLQLANLVNARLSFVLEGTLL